MLYDHYDVTPVDTTFDASASVSNVFFTIVFGSEEFNEFIGSQFIDALAIYFNGNNIVLSTRRSTSRESARKTRCRSRWL